MVVLYRRANHTSIGYRIVLASSDRTGLCYNIEEFLIFIDQVYTVFYSPCPQYDSNPGDHIITYPCTHVP